MVDAELLWTWSIAPVDQAAPINILFFSLSGIIYWIMQLDNISEVVK